MNKARLICTVLLFLLAPGLLSPNQQSEHAQGALEDMKAHAEKGDAKAQCLLRFLELAPRIIQYRIQPHLTATIYV